MARVFILGIGNALLTDEGVGVRAVNELERRFVFPPEVEVLDGGTAGIELLRHILGHEYLIIIDAMLFRKPPGTITRLQGEEVPAAFRTRISPHQLGLSDLLAAGRLTGDLPENLILFGVEPESVDIGLELSPEVERSMEALLAAVVGEVAVLGHVLQPVNGDFTRKAHFWDRHEKNTSLQ